MNMQLKNGWYKEGESPYGSPIVAARQPQKGPDARRICVNYGEVNKCAVRGKNIPMLVITANKREALSVSFI